MAFQRKRPAPHQRPSIDLGSPRKVWQEIQAQHVEVEDLVVDMGTVRKVTVSANVAIEFVSEKVEFFPLEDTLMVFTRPR